MRVHYANRVSHRSYSLWGHRIFACLGLNLVVFPGGFLPTLTFLVDTLTKGSQGKLVVDSVSNIGPHYSRTLREWRRRFEARFEDVITPGMALHSHYLAANFDF